MPSTVVQGLKAFAICLLLATVGALAQEPAPRFEVATIKPTVPGTSGGFIKGSPGGRLDASNNTLKRLFAFAYQLQPFQISGGPPWLDSDHWDIAAKPETDPGPNHLALMMQGLLSDRFALKFHRETREMPVYALVAAKTAGTATPGLSQSKEGACSAPGTRADPPDAGKEAKRPCGLTGMGPGNINIVAQPVAQLIPILSFVVGRTVIDKTGLTGKFDIHLEWSPDETPDSSGPSIFTAIQEQLGLRLESRRGPVEIFVIDRAEKPSEN